MPRTLEEKALSKRQLRARDKARGAEQVGAQLPDDLLRRLLRDDAELNEDEEQRLADEITAAKQELYRRRGGPDAELQLCHDIGEIYPL